MVHVIAVTMIKHGPGLSPQGLKAAGVERARVVLPPNSMNTLQPLKLQQQ
jgi:hypothetical protein